MQSRLTTSYDNDDDVDVENYNGDYDNDDDDVDGHFPKNSSILRSNVMKSEKSGHVNKTNHRSGLLFLTAYKPLHLLERLCSSNWELKSPEPFFLQLVY